jgi:hypothetical protein
VRQIAEARDARLILEPMALPEGSANLNAVRENLEFWPGPDSARVLVEISRYTGSGRRRSAAPMRNCTPRVTLSVLAYTTDADDVAPAIRDETGERDRGLAVCGSGWWHLSPFQLGHGDAAWRG